LLRIHVLYKATEGDITAKRPGLTDLVGRAKWDAWKAVEDKSSNEAMQAYLDLIESLK
jgi:diazepam-binding inhibitor (GABA receptor modulating acyl-CoA-binding protein)